MKIKTFSVPLIMLGVVVNFFYSCNRDKSIPVISTTNVYDVFATSVKITANVINDGGYDIRERGVCWNTDRNPTVRLQTKIIVNIYASVLGPFGCYVTGLKPETTYFIRSFATNILGTAYGNEYCFTTSGITGTVKDVDGNVYDALTIGTQTWMMENLKTTRYRDSTKILNVTGSDWRLRNEGAYCLFENDPSYKHTLGFLYNWYAVNSKHNIAPIGWHVPTNDEWTTLIDYLGGANVAGGALKNPYDFWSYCNYGATNESYFTAFLGGFRNNDYQGTFSGLWNIGCWWTDTENLTQEDSAYFRTMEYNNTSVGLLSGEKHCGFNIRCIKDK